MPPSGAFWALLLCPRDSRERVRAEQRALGDGLEVGEAAPMGRAKTARRLPGQRAGGRAGARVAAASRRVGGGSAAPRPTASDHVGRDAARCGDPDDLVGRAGRAERRERRRRGRRASSAVLASVASTTVFRLRPAVAMPTTRASALRVDGVAAVERK